MALLVACRDCGAIQELPPPPERGRLECWRCERPLEQTTGRSLDGALACSIAALLLLFPANCLPLMTLYILGVEQSHQLFAGLIVFTREGWPFTAAVIGALAIILPFVYFTLLSVTLAAIRSGVRGTCMGTAFRYCEMLEPWAMSDVLLIGAGIGYGRLLSQTTVHIDVGGWCLVGAAFMTMLTRATLERRAVWRRLEMPPSEAGPDAIACTACDLVLPARMEGQRCPRCTASIHRRKPHAASHCAALTAATWALTPVAYTLPMSQFWKAGTPEPHSVINGIMLLFQHGFWYFGVIIFCVSVVFPFTKLLALTWFLLSLNYGWNTHLHFKTGLFRFVDDVGRWSALDPFTVLIFTPMIQLGQLGHFGIMGGAEAFLATVILSMLAARVFDPRLMWDIATEATKARAAQPETAAAGLTA